MVFLTVGVDRGQETGGDRTLLKRTERLVKIGGKDTEKNRGSGAYLSLSSGWDSSSSYWHQVWHQKSYLWKDNQYAQANKQGDQKRNERAIDIPQRNLSNALNDISSQRYGWSE